MSALPEPEIDAIMARFSLLADEVDAAWHDSRQQLTPGHIAAALAELAEALHRGEADVNAGGTPPAETVDLSRLTDQALELLAEMGDMARAAGLQETGIQIELLSIPLVIWSVRRNASIRVTAPVVNALAVLANKVREPSALARLYEEITEIIGAVAPEARAEGAPGDRGHPWRVLLLNRAIVATRTHDPALMEEAYEAVTRQLPDYALRFFEEAMGQMDAIGYPLQVRDVVSRYYQRLSGPRTVH